MIEIDGSYGEGGGQILRTALTLAALTGQATHLTRVRAGRSKPGLAPQHLTGVLAAGRICEAELVGACVGSTELVFRPQSCPRTGEYTFDVTETAQGGSAGAVTLIFQALFPVLALAARPSTLVLKGGTHVPWSPPFDFLAQVFLPIAARMSFSAECSLDAWGFYPRGGGQITATIQPVTAGACPSPAVLTERGELKRVWGRAIACNLEARIAQRMTDRATRVLRQAGLKTEITPKRVRGAGPGAGLLEMDPKIKTSS